MDYREMVARRAALELKDGEVVNLGFGMPTAVANFIPENVNITLQSENGCLKFGPTPKLGDHDVDISNAGGQPITFLPGASVFDASFSFAIIRGGHVDATILGALEVDQLGNISNWARPLGSGKYIPGMGGGMDLAAGARRVVAVLQHCDKKGNSKVLKKCTLPYTGVGTVKVIITDKAVFEVTKEGLVLKEIVPEMTVEELKKITDADFKVNGNVGKYRLNA